MFVIGFWKNVLGVGVDFVKFFWGKCLSRHSDDVKVVREPNFIESSQEF